MWEENSAFYRGVLFILLFVPQIIIAQNQPVSPLVASYDQHQKMKSQSPFGFEWIALGPTLNSARVEAVQADPSSPGTIYAAFGSGGLWKTVNSGMTWRCIFENMPSLGIGDFAMAPSDSDIIYVGTGESLKKARNFTMPGTGIYRSDDGGEHWESLGLSDAWHVGEIVVHPENPDIVFVAVLGHFWSPNKHRGIFKTIDGGKSWSHVLYIDERTGANDITFSPADPNKLYATTWEMYPDVNGANSGIFTSDDGGTTWKKSVKGITIDQNSGRIGIAASYQNPDKAYAFINQRNRAPDLGAGEIYKTGDGGETWQKTHAWDIMALSVVGWYFMDIYVNPLDDEEIFGLGVRLLHSKDGGQNFNYIGGEVHHITPSPAQTLHLDHCELWINPENPNELVLGNDGGLYHSYDKGESWLHLNNLPTGEFYDIEIDNSEPYTIYGGTQDDATVFGNSEEWNPKFNDRWQYLWIDAWSGGDGCITLVDPDDPNTVYFSMQNGGARRMDLLGDTSVSIRPRFRKDENIELTYNFITPYMLSPHNSNVIYMAGNYVMKSENRGDSWQLISPDLIKKDRQDSLELAAGAMSESFFEEGTLYMGTDRGRFWITKNGGLTWEESSSGLGKNYIRNITPSQHKRGRIYLQQTGLNYDDFGAYLYVSEDDGNSWKPIQNNLPDHPINVIVEDPNDEMTLFAGTYRGVYISRDRGGSWTYFGKSMPDASVADIIIENKTRDLIVATHGRGIYKTNLRPFDQLKNMSRGNYIFEIPNAKRPKFRDTHKEVDESTISKVPITFWIENEEQVQLEVLNDADSIVWSRSLLATPGVNQFRWDLVVKEEESMLPYFIHYKRYLNKGTYTLRLITKMGVDLANLVVNDY